MTENTDIWMGVVDPDGKKIPPIECEYIGTEPGEWKTVNPSATEFFDT
jgi:hypothetical protein